jgi:hypothetical protein
MLNPAIVFHSRMKEGGSPSVSQSSAMLFLLACDGNPVPELSARNNGSIAISGRAPTVFSFLKDKKDLQQFVGFFHPFHSSCHGLLVSY